MQTITQEQVVLMKDNMKQTIDQMKQENVEECFHVLTTQYEVLKQLFHIENLTSGLAPSSKDSEELVVSVEESKPMTEEDTTEVESTGITVEERPMYRIERKLRGAFVPDIDGYIPETLFRKEGLSHGDYVYADLVETRADGMKHYQYAFAKKAEEAVTDANRAEYLYCPVERDGHMLVVTRSSITGETIRVDGVPYSVLLSDSDIERFMLDEGDVVDIAFYRNKPSSVKVSWKHSVEDLTQVDNISHTTKSNKGKGKQAKNEIEEIEQVFADKVVCVVGDKPSEATYRQLVEERGGELVHIEPSWGVNRIETLVKKSDVVVGLYDVCSHTGLEKVKAYCKQYGIPYDMISGKGKSKTIQTAVELLCTTAS